MQGKRKSKQEKEERAQEHIAFSWNLFVLIFLGFLGFTSLSSQAKALSSAATKRIRVQSPQPAQKTKLGFFPSPLYSGGGIPPTTWALKSLNGPKSLSTHHKASK